MIRRKKRKEKRKQGRLIKKIIEQNKSMKCLEPKLGQRQILSLMRKEENEINNRKDMLKKWKNFAPNYRKHKNEKRL